MPNQSDGPIRMSRSLRLQRDEHAIKDIKAGQPIGKVADKYGMTRMQLWRRRKAYEAEANPKAH